MFIQKFVVSSMYRLALKSTGDMTIQSINGSEKTFTLREMLASFHAGSTFAQATIDAENDETEVKAPDFGDWMKSEFEIEVTE